MQRRHFVGAPLAPDEHPFRAPQARRFTQMTFNIASYQRLLMDDFLREGGDGLLVATQEPHDFGNADATIDRGVSERAVERLAQLFP